MTTHAQMKARREKVHRLLAEGFSKPHIIEKMNLSWTQWQYCFPKSVYILNKKLLEAKWKEQHPGYWKTWNERHPGYTYQNYKRRKAEREYQKEIWENILDCKLNFDGTWYKKSFAEVADEDD